MSNKLNTQGERLEAECNAYKAYPTDCDKRAIFISGYLACSKELILARMEIAALEKNIEMFKVILCQIDDAFEIYLLGTIFMEKMNKLLGREPK